MLLPPALNLFLLVLGSEIQAQTLSPEADQGYQNESTSLSSAKDILRRNEEIASRLAEKPVQGVRKMSNDEGEKFYLDYWQFLDDAQETVLKREVLESNDTTTDLSESPDEIAENDFPDAIFLPRSYPFQPASSLELSASRWRGLLESRDFKCPDGTNECTSIGRSDRCCGTRDTCEIVPDRGSGDVGCCPIGETCSGTVGSCQNGYTGCSQALGGGCCIPGYDCVAGGCAYTSVVTVTVHSSVVTSTSTYSTIPPSTESSSTSTSSEITDNPVPPARPTSRSTTSDASASRVDVCPTGFYACSAVYRGGCCQTGRDCDTTSCPTTSSTTLTTNGETIIVPVTTGVSHNTGKCAKGWFSCADTAGGGCCPSGFACGTSCTAMAAKTTVAKEEATSGGVRLRMVKTMLGIAGLCVWWTR